MFQTGGLGSALATGAAFGAGSAIAHQALGGMFGHHYGGYGGGGMGTPNNAPGGSTENASGFST